MTAPYVNGTSAWPLRISEKEPVQIVTGDLRKVLLSVPDETVDCCITSPPYWGMRDYGYLDQIGAEKTVEEYISSLTGCFRDVRRVLKQDGTLWLNIGNTYTSGGRKWRDKDLKNQGRAMSYRPDTPEGLKPKDLIGVAWMLAMALQRDGWYLRSDIIWNKPNCQPESVKDRVTVSHEYLFMLSKSENYYFDQAAIKERTVSGNGTKNRRTVWNLNTEALKDAHFAPFPKALVRPCILAGSAPGGLVLDPFFGSGTVGIVALETGRRCLGIEVNPDYTKICKSRMTGIHLPLFTCP